MIHDRNTCSFCKTFINPYLGTEEVVVKPPPQSFEERVVALAKVLLENAPVGERINSTPEFRYKWGDALADATDIILAADGYYIEGDCTCD
jgi:hypothetical protein